MKPLLALVALLLQAPAATHTISGHVTMFPNAAGAPSTLILRSFALHEGPGQGKRVSVRPDGTFEFAGVLPPEFDLNFYDDVKPFQRLVSSSISPPYTVDTPVGPGMNFTISRNATGVEIKAPAPLPGRIVMVGGQRLPRAIAISANDDAPV